jgi:hypothetical protein
MALEPPLRLRSERWYWLGEIRRRRRMSSGEQQPLSQNGRVEPAERVRGVNWT